MSDTLITANYTVNEAIGSIVNQYLFDRRLTKTRLASALGIAQTNASKKVRGNVGWSAEDLIETADLLEVEVQDLLPTPDGHGGWIPASFKPGHRAPAYKKVPQVGLEPTIERLLIWRLRRLSDCVRYLLVTELV